MKKMLTIVLCLILMLSFAGCGKKEEVRLQAEDVYECITYYYEMNGEDGNYINSHIDSERNIVVVELRDISDGRRKEFIHNVFSSSTGSTYIKYLKAHPMLEFVAE